MTAPASAPEPQPLLTLRGLAKRFPRKSPILRRTTGYVHAVDGVDLTIVAGRTVGLVGESGSGKTTLGRIAVRIEDPTEGTIDFDGFDITRVSRRALRRRRQDMQFVFQDPYSSLDPLSPVSHSIGEPLRAHTDLGADARDARVAELLALVGLDPAMRRRYPREFSGGQLQRIAIARALSVQPKLLVLDEPVSSLDVSTQAEVVNLLRDLQAELGVAYLLIAHDLALVEHASHRIAVMYLGRIVEEGPARTVVRTPRHPYTQALLSAVPVPDPTVQRERRRIVLTGDVPSPVAPPSGCRFHTRCQYAMDVCRTDDPPAFETDDGTTVFCHLHTTGPARAGAPLVAPVTAPGNPPH